MVSSGPETPRLVEADTDPKGVFAGTVAVFVAGPAMVAVALIVKVCDWLAPDVANERPVQVTVPLTPTEGCVPAAPAMDEFELTYVKPAGSGSFSVMFVAAVAELFVTVIWNWTTAPWLTCVTGVVVLLASVTCFEIVSAAVLTRTPVGSVPVSVPTFVEACAVLKNVPPVLPDFTVKVMLASPGLATG